MAMEFQVEIPQEEFSEFLDAFLGQEYEGNTAEQEQEGESSFVVEYDGSNLGAYLGNAGMTVAIGLIVVMAALIVLTMIFKGFGLAMGSGGKRKRGEGPQESRPASEASAAAASGAPFAEPDGISDEIIAVIAAAVAAMAPQGKRYAVKKVSRVPSGGRSAWSAAGISENTRPF